jgi:cellulose synthase/poly-beta-1,6-N-acetylglucosamine synthase-like glycosyltransferase
MARPPSLSVVIPTYQRPDWIRRAVQSLAVQDRVPDEVIAVSRDTDLPTHASIAAMQAEALPFPLRRELVVEPDFMPPVRVGLAAARCDVVAVMDDDAEACDGWARTILSHYADPRVGAVGGRCINTIDGKGPEVVPDTDRVGYVSPMGHFVGKMFCNPTFTEPVEVDFLMGGNMSFRRQVARRLEFDMVLNRGVAIGYEVDIGLQVRRMAWKIVFDPRIAIRHYSAPRAQAGMRADSREGIQGYAFNQARVALRRLPFVRRSVSFAYGLAMGERRAPGLVPHAVAPLARKLGYEIHHATSALRGRLLAARSVLEGAS